MRRQRLGSERFAVKRSGDPGGAEGSLADGEPRLPTPGAKGIRPFPAACAVAMVRVVDAHGQVPANLRRYVPLRSTCPPARRVYQRTVHRIPHPADDLAHPAPPVRRLSRRAGGTAHDAPVDPPHG